MRSGERRCLESQCLERQRIAFDISGSRQRAFEPSSCNGAIGWIDRSSSDHAALPRADPPMFRYSIL
jgi:hypothetical protein